MLKRSNQGLIFVMVLTLFFSLIPVSQAAANTSVFKKVYITSKSYIELTDANIIPSASGATASFTLNIYNGDNADINLIDYWARLTSTSNTKYKLTLLDSDKKKRVQPKSTVQLVYYSEIGSNVTLDQLIFNFVKFDFNVAGYEKTIAQFKFPSGFVNSVKWGGFRAIPINHAKVNMRVDKVKVSQSKDNYSINLTYVARNTSHIGVNLPQYKYYIQTAKGLFKLAPKNAEQTLTLDPTVLNEIELIGKIPVSISAKGWKLIIAETTNNGTSDIDLPVVIFETPFTIDNQVDTSPTTDKVSFTNSDGSYEVQFNTVQRFPMNNSDYIIAELTVKNTDTKFLPIPDLSGLFVVDDGITLDSKIIKNIGDLGIAPKAATTVTYVATIPYTYTWESLKLRLTQNNDELLTNIADLTKSKITPMKVIPVSGQYEQANNGAPFEAKITDLRSYKGTRSDTVAVYIDMKNTQKRASSMALLSGFFRTTDGNLYEAKISNVEGVIKPSNKDQLVVWADIPVNVDRSGMQLILGEAFDDNGLILSKGTPTGYLRAVQFDLPQEKDYSNSFNEIKTGPYSIDLTYLKTWFDDYQMKLYVNIGSTIQKDYSYDGHMPSNLYIEIENETAKQVIFTKEIGLETASEGAVSWKVGENYSALTKDIEENAFWSSYSFKVYEVFNGNKKLLVKKEIQLSPSIDWSVK